MRDALGTYSENARRTASDLLGVLAIERVCSQVEFAQERLRRVEQQIEREKVQVSAMTRKEPMNERSLMKEYAAADRRHARSPLTDETRVGLHLLKKKGARCETCYGPAVLVRAGVLLCGACGNVARQRAQRDRMRAGAVSPHGARRGCAGIPRSLAGVGGRAPLHTHTHTEGQNTMASHTQAASTEGICFHHSRLALDTLTRKAQSSSTPVRLARPFRRRSCRMSPD